MPYNCVCDAGWNGTACDNRKLHFPLSDSKIGMYNFELVICFQLFVRQLV